MNDWKNKKVAVLAGGPCDEADVSRMSLQSVQEALEELQIDYKVFDPGHYFIDEIREYNPDVAFNCLHGIYGEDGIIQGVLEYLNIPYTHSGIYTSSCGMDKIKTRDVLAPHGVRFADSKLETLDHVCKLFEQKKHPRSMPYVLKPCNQGSALGVYIVEARDQFPDLSDWQYGDQLMVEDYIPGIELTCGIVDGQPLEVIELKPKRGFYDYEAKYSEGIVEHILPAKIPNDIRQLCQKYTKIAYDVLGINTCARVDFRFNPKKGEEGLHCLEVNTHPGLTKLSLLPEAAAYSGISFADLVLKLLNNATISVGGVNGSKTNSRHNVRSAAG